MTNVIDMSTPVTRGELRDELAQFENRIERKIDDKLGHLELRFDDKLGHLEHKIDDKLGHLERKIDDKLGHLEQKIDDKLGHFEHKFDDKIGHLERKFDDKLDLWGGALLARITESEKRVVGELARHTQAVFESMTKQISAVDEKYQDLPGRADRLEVEVHALKNR